MNFERLTETFGSKHCVYLCFKEKFKYICAKQKYTTIA